MLTGEYKDQTMESLKRKATVVQDFYENQCVFITGGTGFLGKCLIEKLLRSCPGISKIFILVRERKGKKLDERLEDFLKDSVFDKCRSNKINFKEKIYAIAGDCGIENLNLSDDDVDCLTREVSIVFHVAATVRFDEKLKDAVTTNIRGTSNIVSLCKKMDSLKAFVHVSTSYANCFVSNIEEKFYDYSISHKELIHLIDTSSEASIEARTQQLIAPWPNTYTFTKALAEELIRDECKSLPVSIFRPGIVMPSAYEPTPGWLNDYNGPIGLSACVAKGVMRTSHCDPEKLANFIPVDFTVNALIVSAWDSKIQRVNRKIDDTLIYNSTSTNDAPITWGKVARNMVESTDRYPLRDALWCAMLCITKRKFLYNLYVLFLHLIPACFVDFGLLFVGRKPRLLKEYQKIYKIANATSYFALNEWQFQDDNVRKMWDRLDVRDQQIFRFSMIDFDWDKYFAHAMMGIRVFLFKDDLKTLKSSRKKYNRYLHLHRLITASLVAFACWSVFLITL